MTFDYASQTVLITGASSGIGRSFSISLAQRGASLVLVARRLDRLAALAAELSLAHGISVEVIALDLTSPTAATELRAITDGRGIQVTSLVNNAGFGTFGPFIDENLARLTAEIAVDITAPVSLSHVFLPDLQKKGDGFL